MKSCERAFDLVGKCAEGDVSHNRGVWDLVRCDRFPCDWIFDRLELSRLSVRSGAQHSWIYLCQWKRE